MASTLPPDPYLALGVPKDATAAAIKSMYRKLVLRCHPDKVTDESLKKQKQEEFHKIQQAYELIGDEDKRSKYDAEVRLEQLRKEKLARSGSQVEVGTARYDVRTAAPAGATFSASGPPRYEEPKSTSRPYDDDRRYDERSSRKYDTYEAYPKHSSSRTARLKEEPIRVTRVSSDRTRSERQKTRDRDARRDRSNKFVFVDDDTSSSDDKANKAYEKARREADYVRRSDEARRKQREDDEARQAAAEARRKADTRRVHDDKEPRRHRSSEDREFDRERKLNEQSNLAARYIHRSKVEAERPSPSRTTSSRDVRPEAYESRSRRPEVRRSSARPKDRPESSPRERKVIPEIVDWEKPPSFKHSSSSPAEIHLPRTVPTRSYTESARDRRTEPSATPIIRRSETMPSVSHPSSSRRKEATVSRLSGLRSSETVTLREPETTFRTMPPGQSSSSSTKYYYPTPGGGITLHPEDMVGSTNGHRTVTREPERHHRTRSPSPLSRPPMGANRPVEIKSPRTASSVFPPSLNRSATLNAGPPREEERGRMLYGERTSDFTRRENTRRQTSFSPDSISYAPKILPEDIRWSSKHKHTDQDRESQYEKPPTLSRHATYVY